MLGLQRRQHRLAGSRRGRFTVGALERLEPEEQYAAGDDCSSPLCLFAITPT